MGDQTREITRGALVIRSAREGAEHVTTLLGDLDIHSCELLETEIAALEATDAERIVVDLSRLEFIDSAGLNALMRAHARSRANGKRLVLRRGSPAVQRVFAITNTEKLLPFED